MTAPTDAATLLPPTAPAVRVTVLDGGAHAVLLDDVDVSASPRALDAAQRAAALAPLERRTGLRGPAAWVAACFPAIAAPGRDLATDDLVVPAHAVPALRQPTWGAAVRAVAPTASRGLVRAAARRFGGDVADPRAYGVLPALALVALLLGDRPDAMVSALEDPDAALDEVARTGISPADAVLLASLVGPRPLRHRQRIVREALRAPWRWREAMRIVDELSLEAQAELNADHDGLGTLLDGAHRLWAEEHRWRALPRPTLPPAQDAGLRLRAPSTPEEIARWGADLWNCLDAGYGRRILGGHANLLAVVEPDVPEPVALVEVVDGRVHQLLGSENARPDETVLEAVVGLLAGVALLSDDARARLLPGRVVRPLLAEVDAPGFRDDEERAATAAVLWCVGWLRDPDEPVGPALRTLRALGLVTPPQPVRSVDEVCLRYPPGALRERLLGLLRAEVPDDRQLALGA
jgi:hypothetical protein